MSDPDILNWRRLNGRFTTSGQPTEEQLGEIAALGVKRVVNLALHTHEKALPDEAASVARLGMGYTHIPVAFDNPTAADFERFVAAVEAIGEAPTHVHCILNARVTAFFYRYQREILGMSEAEARAMMDSVWRPGGVWAAFIGDEAGVGGDHQYAGRDYVAG